MQACTADEGLVPSGRFRDADFFLSYERTAQNGLQEEGLGMGMGEDLVLDIAADDQVGLRAIDGQWLDHFSQNIGAHNCANTCKAA